MGADCRDDVVGWPGGAIPPGHQKIAEVSAEMVRHPDTVGRRLREGRGFARFLVRRALLTLGPQIGVGSSLRVAAEWTAPHSDPAPQKESQ